MFSFTIKQRKFLLERYGVNSSKLIRKEWFDDCIAWAEILSDKQVEQTFRKTIAKEVKSLDEDIPF